jgi:hypothetical protein
MSDQVRAWKVLRSFQLALIVGGLAGIVITGLAYNKFLGDLDPRGSILLGAGIAVGLTLILTYVFDQVSKSVKTFTRAVKGEGRKSRSKGDG